MADLIQLLSSGLLLLSFLASDFYFVSAQPRDNEVNSSLNVRFDRSAFKDNG